MFRTIPKVWKNLSLGHCPPSHHKWTISAHITFVIVLNVHFNTVIEIITPMMLMLAMMTGGGGGGDNEDDDDQQ